MKFSFALIKKIAPGNYDKKLLVEKLNLHSLETADLGGDVLEAAVMPNRFSDLASHLGVAREASVILKTKFSDPTAKNFRPNVKERGIFTVNLKEKSLCRRYLASYVTDLKIGKTPVWMKEALESCGPRSINLIVDIMNYVMLEIGQPLHAFDADKVSGGLVVRLATKGEELETIDGKNIRLDEKTLVIADGKRPLAIAGIKGGKFSEVNVATKRILVEAAQFQGANIYQTSRRIGLATDASLRFSHNLSLELASLGMKRALQLLQELAHARVYAPTDVYSKPQSRVLLRVDTRKISQLLGAEIPTKEIWNTLTALGFWKVGLRVEAPLTRTDIENPEDLAEEVARIHGYNNLLSRPPHLALSSAVEEDLVRLKDRVRQFLVQAGFSEVYNYSFYSQKEASPEAVKIANPISRDLEFLRESLVPALKKNLDQNLKNFKEVRFFEIGRVFHWQSKELQEESALCAALAMKDAYQELRGLLESLLDSFGATDYELSGEGGGLLLVKLDNSVIGRLELLPELGAPAAALEVNLDKLLALVSEEREFKTLPKFPSVVRDISLYVSEDLRVGQILEAIENFGGKNLVDVDLLDFYTPTREELRGKDKKEPLRKSLTFRLVFQAEDRTLTDDEVNREVAIIQKMLTDRFEAELR